MSSPSRVLRLAAYLLLWIVPVACVAQQTRPQFVQPAVELTRGGRVTSFVPGSFQQVGQQSGLPDFLYINARTLNGTTPQVTVGELLNKQGFTDLGENQIVFSNVLGVAAAVGYLDGDSITDYAFALSPSVAGGNDLCVYYGTGAGFSGSAYSGGNGYPPGSTSGKSGCLAFSIQGSLLPTFAYVAAVPLKTGIQLSELIVEDTANGYVYVLNNSGAAGNAGALTGFAVRSAIALPSADGAGPMYTGDFNHDGNTDFIVNGQTGNSASVYFGNGDGTFRAPVRYAFDKHVHSLLLNDMDGDGVLDMVVEGDGGVIEIFHGNTDGSFATTSLGGTAAGLDGFSGNGGHLVAALDLNNDGVLDIVTATPAGISVLMGQGGFAYKLKAIYNVGPGRSSYALADFDGDGRIDLAVDSPEGIAIASGNGDGSFLTSLAYSTGLPALGSVVGKFRGAGSNPGAHLDVVAATTLGQAQLLMGDGTGGFVAAPTPANPNAPPASSVWSFPVSGDFDGDGNLDLVYTTTGLPLQPSTIGQKGLTITYGNGDGTFSGQYNYSLDEVGLPLDNTLYGEYAAADLNGDGRADLAVVDPKYFDTLLGSATRTLNFNVGLNSVASSAGANAFDQVAAGFFASGRMAKQDLVFQSGGDIIPYSNVVGDGKTFTAMPKLAGTPDPSVLFPAAMLLTDMDGDTKGDVVVLYYSLAGGTAQLYVWYGNGDGSFLAPQVMPMGRNYYLAGSADMNSDGLADLVLSDGALVDIIYNKGARSFGATVNGAFFANEQHFLAGQGINSLSLADVNGDGYPDLLVADGGVTISNPLALGAKSAGATSVLLTANPDVNTGGVTVLLNNVQTKAVTGTLTAAPEPSKLGTAFTLTATLTPSAGVAAPMGSVQFSIDGVVVGGVVALVQGAGSSTASYTVLAGNSYAAGTHALSASYGGDLVNSQAVVAGSHAIQGLIPTTTTLALCVGGSAPNCPVNGVPNGLTPVSPLTMSYGQVFNGTETVTDTDGSTFTGTGTLNFYQDGTLLCTLQASAGLSCPANVGTGTTAGTHVFMSVYGGDATHAGSTSQPVTIQVLQDTTQASLVGVPSISPQGSAVAFTATLIGNYAAPTGTVTLSYNGNIVGTGAMVASASGTTSAVTIPVSTLPVGTDTVTLTYAANQNFLGASATFVETITQVVVATTTTLTSSLNPSIFGQSVTFTATVSSSGVAAGQVTFLDGATALGTGTLNGAGIATLSTSALAVGSHSITASYAGTATTSASVSTALLQQVNPVPGTGSFTVTVTPTPVTIGVGLSASLQVTVTALNGFAQAVNLSCANLPSESGCTFVRPTIPIGGGTTNLVISTMAPHTCGTTQPYFTGRNGSPLPFGLPVMAGLAMLFVPGRRRWLRVVIALVAVAGAMQMTGCSTCTDLGTRPNTYTIQVSGAAAGGAAEVETQSVTMKVTI